jgi:hypothetical protein
VPASTSASASASTHLQLWSAHRLIPRQSSTVGTRMCPIRSGDATHRGDLVGTVTSHARGSVEMLARQTFTKILPFGIARDTDGLVQLTSWEAMQPPPG